MKGEPLDEEKRLTEYQEEVEPVMKDGLTQARGSGGEQEWAQNSQLQG